jgi:dCTP deaminase
MILSDHSIREELKAGRIVIDPIDERDIQPSSVDLHIDRFFRVFRNHCMRVIDVKQDQEELTELVEIDQDDGFVLHPGEFVLGSTAGRVALPDDLVARLEGKSSLGRLGLLIHSTAGICRRRLGWPPDAGAVQRGQPSHHPVPGHEDRPDQLPADDDAG